MDPVKGKQFKNIDQSIIEIQKNIKHMPISIESIALKCRNDIANCKDFNELKHSLFKEFNAGINNEIEKKSKKNVSQFNSIIGTQDFTNSSIM